MTDSDISSSQLGRLQRRDAREVWAHEAHEFTPWLQRHIDQLNEAIGFEIELSAREERIGPFAVDLYGREVQTGHPAIVENQLEPSDHTHLGQLLTYAAGLKAGVVVWIAPKFRDEHRAALNWLNEISSQDVNFFGVEIEILEINSQRAPNFNLVVRPNDWVGPRAASIGGSRGISERRLTYQAYFAELLAELKDRKPGVTTASKTRAQNWFAFGSGKAGVHFVWAFASNDRFRVEVIIGTRERDRNTALFEAFYQDHQLIEQTIGAPLQWERLEQSQRKRIAAYAPFAVSIFSPQDELQQLKEWVVSTMVKFVDTFRPRLKALSEE